MDENPITDDWHHFISTLRYRTWEENDPTSCPFTMMLNLLHLDASFHTVSHKTRTMIIAFPQKSIDKGSFFLIASRLSFRVVLIRSFLSTNAREIYFPMKHRAHLHHTFKDFPALEFIHSFHFHKYLVFL